MNFVRLYCIPEERSGVVHNLPVTVEIWAPGELFDSPQTYQLALTHILR